MTYPVGHLMIVASAGCGKTHALTGRFIRLLLLGVDPKRITALTFTRKAAGEFLETIVSRLVDACKDDAQAAKLAGQIELPHTTRAEFENALGEIAREIGHLNLGTLDGFFTRMLQCFAPECGLPTQTRILEGPAEQRAALDALAAMLSGGETDPDTFLRLFDETVHGAAKLRVTETLASFTNDHRARYLEAEHAAWGDPAALWPSGYPWEENASAATLAAQLREALDASPDLNDKQRARVENLADELEFLRPGAPFPKAANYFIERLLPALPDLSKGDCTLMLEKKNTKLSPALCAAFASLARFFMHTELSRRLRRTRSVGELLVLHDKAYRAGMQTRGAFAFHDLPHLLLGLPEIPRTQLEYRFDASLDHWLLDEFQDTSRIQWAVVRNLVDEILQDDTGRRSFFYVGDIKQAIYGWRGGDHRLFFEIEERYREPDGTPRIKELPLHVSHRSARPVLDLVNRVFGNLEAVGSNLELPGPTIAAWNKAWQNHESAHQEVAGFAEYRTLDPDDIPSAVVDLLKEIRPSDRGLTTAILCRSNNAVLEFVDLLRAEGIEAASESDQNVCADNPLGSALLSLFQLAAHPGDTAAICHIRMSPFEPLLHNGTGSFVAKTLGSIFSRGFARTASDWLASIAPLPTDPFSQERAEDFLAAARAFDADGPRDIDAFLAQLRETKAGDTAAPTAVQVMTIHKSKGLGFDLVILPQKDKGSFSSPKGGEFVEHRTKGGKIDWLIELPPKEYCEADPVLAGLRGQLAAESMFEDLCVAYVAMTRAKRGLHIFAPEPGKSNGIASLLARTLPPSDGEHWSTGDARWYESVKPPEPKQSAQLHPPLDPKSLPERTRRRSPSEAARSAAPGPWNDLGGTGGVGLGSEIHGYLAGLEWIGNTIPSTDSLLPAAAALLRPCLESKAVRDQIFTRPETPCILWREQRFEQFADNAWTSGAFDRAIILLGPDGKPASARIFDFKTDAASPEATAAEYAPQLAEYRKAAASILGLPEAAITSGILHVRTGRVIDAR